MLRKSAIWFAIGFALVMAISMELVWARNHSVPGKNLFPIIVDSILECAAGLLIASVFFACRYFLKSEWLGMIVGSILALALAMPILRGYEVLSDLILGTNHPSAQALSLIVGLSVPFSVRLAVPLRVKKDQRRTEA